jgi:hypothetical protein
MDSGAAMAELPGLLPLSERERDRDSPTRLRDRDSSHCARCESGALPPAITRNLFLRAPLIYRISLGFRLLRFGFNPLVAPRERERERVSASSRDSLFMIYCELRWAFALTSRSGQETEEQRNRGTERERERERVSE